MVHARRVVVCTAAVLAVLAGCGQANDKVETVAVTSTTATSTATTESTDGVRVDTDPSTTTTTPNGYFVARDNQKLRGKVRDALQDFWDEYQFLAVVLGDEGISEEDVDKAIYDACTGKDQAEAEIMTALVMFAGETLRQHGRDAVGVAADLRKTNERVDDLVDC